MKPQEFYSTSNYLVLYRFTDDQINAVKDLSSKYGFRVVQCNTRQNLENALKKITHSVGIFANFSDLSEHEANALFVALNNARFPVRIFDKAQSKETLIQELVIFLERLKPAGLENLIIESINYNIPIIFKLEKTIKLQITQSEAIPIYSHMILCDTIGRTWAGRCSISFDLNPLRAQVPSFKNHSDSQIIDAVRELMNHFLGTLNFTLLQSDLPTLYVTFPSVVKLHANGKRPKSSLFITSVKAIDKEQLLYLEFGILQNSKTEGYDLSKIRFVTPHGSIDLF